MVEGEGRRDSFDRSIGVSSVIAFYEKVIKVKADVAAFLINCFPSVLSSAIAIRDRGSTFSCHLVT